MLIQPAETLNVKYFDRYFAIQAVLEIVVVRQPTGTIWNNQFDQTKDVLWSVSFNKKNEIVAVGDDGIILKSTDNGTEWTTQTKWLTKSSLNALSFCDENNGLMVGSDGTIFKTSDGGNNWEKQSSGTKNSLYDVCLIDNLNGTIVGDNGTILNTTNGGETWISQAQFLGTNQYFYKVNFFNKKDGWIFGYYTDRKHEILKTSDGANSWSVISNNIIDYLHDIIFFNS